MRILTLLLIAPFALLLPACGPSEAPPGADSPATALPAGGSPEAVTEIYFDELAKGDWETISGKFHPDSLTEFRRLVDFLEKVEQHPGAIQARAAFFAPGTTPQTVAAFTDKELFVRVMKALMSSPQSLARISETTLEVIGTVPDGSDRAHVVIRVSPKSDPTNDVIETITCIKDGETWKVTLTGSMKNNLLQLRNKIGSVTGAEPGTPPPGTSAPAPPPPVPATPTAPPLAPKEL